MVQDRRSHGMAHHSEGKDRRGVWIGNVRVSVGELASWQLGPDLTRCQQSVFSQRRRATDRH